MQKEATAKIEQMLFPKNRHIIIKAAHKTEKASQNGLPFFINK